MMWNAFSNEHTQEYYNKDNVFAEFLQTAGLYATTDITAENLNDWISLLNGDVPLHSFCVECKKTSVFRMEPICILTDSIRGKSEQPLSDCIKSQRERWKVLNTPSPNFPLLDEPSPFNWRSSSEVRETTNVICFSFKCAMDKNHRIDYVVTCDDTSIRKIGQFPSVADLSFPELDNYRKILSKEDRCELRRAIGLHAQGIGVGSYVYLRRIFERLLNQTKALAISDGNLDEVTYAKAHVGDKVKLLKGYLPQMIVDTPVFYGIVSKGVHELSEKDCIAYFPVMQEFIMMVLRQKDQLQKEKEAAKRLSASMSKIASDIL